MKTKSARLIPLFDTHSAFVKTTEAEYEESRPYISEYIAGFQDQLDARSDYDAVRQFLKSNSKVETTFNNYRTQVERLLLWAWNNSWISAASQMHRGSALQYPVGSSWTAACSRPTRIGALSACV
jgi:hypothetical protein